MMTIVTINSRPPGRGDSFYGPAVALPVIQPGREAAHPALDGVEEQLVQRRGRAGDDRDPELVARSDRGMVVDGRPIGPGDDAAGLLYHQRGGRHVVRKVRAQRAVSRGPEARLGRG